MAYYNSNIRNGNLIRMPEYQMESNNPRATLKKKQIVLEREGKYYCTYIVDENGHKILLNRVPAQAEEQKVLGKPIKSAIKPYDCNAAKNERTVFECKQQIRMEASQKENLQGIMDILNQEIGILNKPRS